MKIKKRLIGWIVVAVLIALAVALREPALLAIGDFLATRDDLHPADVIHVISGPDYRAAYGIELMRAGYGKQIFFTGQWCAEVQDVHAERGMRQALSQGVAPTAILTDATPIISTYEEALRLKALIEASPSPIHSVILVSDPFHMRRARWTYRHILGQGVEIQMAPVPFERASLQRRWWQDRYSIAAVREEYLKFGYYLARYGLGWAPLSNWLATFDRE